VAKGVPTKPHVLGILEDKQKETLEIVVASKEVDAPGLAEKYDEPNEASANKWNNRLAALAAKGILKERRVGRTKHFSPILEGLTYGN
jgi:hypothetical protein